MFSLDCFTKRVSSSQRIDILQRLERDLLKKVDSKERTRGLAHIAVMLQQERRHGE
jgi:hypothetical protein